jgi:ABC-2 type transport system permease protein
MRLLAEEKKSGTDELLYTSPLTVGQIVLGKYFAALVMLALMLGLTALLSIFVFALGNPELAPWLTGYLGLFLLGATCLAVGLFFSALTENQIVAAVLTFLTLLLLLVLNWISQLGSGSWQGVVGYLSFSQHFEDMTRGILDTKDLVYYVSFSFFGLFLAHSALQSRRWR